MKFESKMARSIIIDLNNIEIKPRYQSYESIVEGAEYRVDKFCYREDENGIQLLMFFDHEQFFLKLPTKFCNYYRTRREDLQTLNDVVSQLGIAFKFEGYNSYGDALFKFGKPGQVD